MSGKAENNNSPLYAVSPLDGRYSEKVAPLKEYFSEFALIKARVQVELLHLLALDRQKVFPELLTQEKENITLLMMSFSEENALEVKEIEKTTQHDVKAVEYFLRKRLNMRFPNMIHFGLTSEDINNLAWTSLIKSFSENMLLPRAAELLKALCIIAERHSETPFPTRTHGQAASPSTAGKELAVYISRILRIYNSLKCFRFRGKLNGAVGNHSALVAAFPMIDWDSYARKLVNEMGFEFNQAVTQIEDHDSWAEFFDLVRHFNNIVIDLNQDIWNYLMLGFFSEKTVGNEVGSSTMPHKVNPIRFENSEGNLLVSNAMLTMFSDKLCRSRMQRDLSDSTVTRNIGVALAHSWLATGETLSGFNRIDVNIQACQSDLLARPELLSEPIQTILRTVENAGDPYDMLKTLTRGKKVTSSDIKQFIESLNVKDKIKESLCALEVTKYTGIASQICRKVIAEAKEALKL
ncbi:MAG: adenylosuccinate lyase [Candidatus Riflebacteria bacterium]|nr:adenylosuccinate lyase [Candidatus Riflebacteria bacterium]